MSKILPDLAPLCVPIQLIDHDPDNVNVHSPEQIVRLRDTLRTYGQHKPLVVQEKNGRYLCRIGNGTLEAAKREGWTEIAVVRANEDDVKATARAIRDNTAPWGSEFDTDTLQEQLKFIETNDKSLMAGLGWSPDELSELIGHSTDYLSLALSQADSSNDALIFNSKLDEEDDELPELEPEEDYTAIDESIVISVDDSEIVMSASDVAEWLSSHPYISEDVINVLSDLYHPAKFFKVYDPATKAFQRVTFVVTHE